MLRGTKRRKTHKSFFHNGLTLPGYNYLGPFNAKNNGPPTTESDRLAQKHDDQYEIIQRKSGSRIRAYTRYNEFDKEFIENAIKEDDYGAKAGVKFFKWKKNWLPTDTNNYAQDITPFKQDFMQKAIGFKYKTPDSVKRGPQQDISPLIAKKLSFENSLRTAQMGDANMDGDGSGKNQGNLGETEVDRITSIHRGS